MSRADLALWHAFTADIAPLFGHTPPEPPPASDPAPEAAPPKPLAKPAAAAPQRALAPEIRVGEQPGGLDRRRWRALRKGDAPSERTLDLHGRRVNDAHVALRAFLHDAALDGVRMVTVVTGKGPQPDGGILRRELPHWLNAADLRPLVLGAAHPHPTNTGAVNILLRKRHRAK
ncbi:Smr/MutS family protein [Falsiroseomonas sp.]|uniref:Smr/MutS family protein n=1 Tax=Falsiroseomonas sp. TaxID=2870721 RepID=UPI003567691D